MTVLVHLCPMDIKEIFRITCVPDTVINKIEHKLAIGYVCQRIRSKLLESVPTLEPYTDMIYVRRGETIKGNTPVFAVIIQDAFVLISEHELDIHFDQIVANAGLNLHHQLRIPAMA